MKLDAKVEGSPPAAGKQQETPRTQIGALCYRMMRGDVQVLLITSRTRRRWIVPKGWPIDGTTPAETAATEAWEEAGVVGKLRETCLGLFGYTKLGGDGEQDVPCVVAVYPIRVKSLASEYPERQQRRRKWFSPKKAASKVAEPELRRLLREFDPARLS